MRHWCLAAVAFAFAMICSLDAIAATLYWAGTGTSWASASSWSTAGGVTPMSAANIGDDVVFDTFLPGSSVVSLNSNAGAAGLTVRTPNSVLIQSGAGDNALAIGSHGITMQPTSGSLTINSRVVAFGGQIWTNNSSSILFANAEVFGSSLQISGTGPTIFNGSYRDGSLVKTGSGDLILSGVNSFAGGTTFVGGRVIAAPDTALGTGSLYFAGGVLQLTAPMHSSRPMALLSAGSVLDTHGFDAVLAGAISGAGSLTKRGAGALLLVGANTFTGDLIVEGGSVGILGSSNSQIGTAIIQRNFEQKQNAPLRIDLQGTSDGQFDTLNVSQTATLGGPLEINATALPPVPSSTLFPVVTAGSIVNAFSSISWSGANNGYFRTKTIGTTVYAEYQDRGNMNGDTVLDDADYDLFAFGLMNRSVQKYAALCQSISPSASCDITPQQGGDFNGNGRLDFDDIAGFQSRLGGLGMSTGPLFAALERYSSAVPEPPVATLLFLFMGIFVARRGGMEPRGMR